MLYAIQVMTGEERRTVGMCRLLISEEILTDLFYPETETMKRFHGKWNKLRRAMFPGYIFAETEQIDELRKALGHLPKLTKVLGTDKTPVALSEEESTWLNRITNGEHVAGVSVGILEGDRLVVTEGPMQGMEGMVKKINRHKRQAVVEVEMFGRKMDVTMGLEVVEKR